MTPRIALLVIGDGRDRLQVQTLQSCMRAVGADGARLIVAKVTVDDRTHRLGFCGAIQAGWAELRRIHDEEPFDYVFHLEEDWLFERPVDLAGMARVLEIRREHAAMVGAPDLAQISLRRNAVNQVEKAAGGLVELWPDEYLDTMHGEVADEESTLHYLEHGLYFTTNPSLYRYSLLAHPWPDAPGCEREFTEHLLARGYRFAVWGKRSDGHWITHTGTRTGRGY